jgi:hypothetical protein
MTILNVYTFLGHSVFVIYFQYFSDSKSFLSGLGLPIAAFPINYVRRGFTERAIFKQCIPAVNDSLLCYQWG